MPDDKNGGMGAPETQTAPLLEEKREFISVLDRAVAKAEHSDIALDDLSPARSSRLVCFPVRFSGSLKRLAGAFRPKAIRDGEGQRPVHQGGLPKQTWNDRARSNVARLQSRD